MAIHDPVRTRRPEPADNLLAFRAHANQRHGADIKITVTDLLIRACATALSAHPEINVSWDETRILRRRHVSIGIAVAIDDTGSSSPSSATPTAGP